MRGVVALFIAVFLFVNISVLYISARGEESVGNTLYVGGSGPGNYSSIHNAIVAASERDTVFVYNGTYYENVVVNKSVNIIGENKETTIIDGGGWFGVGYVFKIMADQVNISGFTIKNSTNAFGPFDELLHPGDGILIDANNSIIIENIITENTFGINIENSFHNKITNNIFIDNGNGIYLTQSSDTIIIDNEITADNRNFAVWDWSNFSYGISMYNSYNNIVTNNTISNISGIGIQLSYLSENNSIYFNNFINNSENANDSCINNSWDNGEYGNYWDDYGGIDKNNDGIGDVSYPMPGGYNQDRYPLMMPYYGIIRTGKFYVDEGSLYRMLIIGMIVAILFCLPIGYIWYRKYYKIK